MLGTRAVPLDRLVLWIVYLASGKKGFAWVGLALLLIVAGLGFGMLALWLRRRQALGARKLEARTTPSANTREEKTGYRIDREQPRGGPRRASSTPHTNNSSGERDTPPSAQPQRSLGVDREGNLELGRL